MDTFFTSSYDQATVKSATEPYAVRGDKASDVKSISCALVFDSCTDIRLLVKPVAGYTGSAPTATVDGDDVEVVKVSGTYRVTLQDIPAHKLGNRHTVTFRTDAGLSTIEASGLSYVHSVVASAGADEQDKINAMGAIYAYYQQASSYNG